MFHRFIQFLDPILVIGVIVSFGLALILVFIGQDEVISLLIGLVSTTITLLIDLVARQRQSEQNIIEAMKLGKLLATNPLLSDTTRQIAQDYQSVQRANFDYFILRFNDALLECREVMHRLAEGSMTVAPHGKYAYGRAGLDSSRISIKAVAYAKADYWHTNLGESYTRSNIEAIQRGVRVMRVWVYSRDILNDFIDVMEKQRQAGIEVFAAVANDLPRDLLEDYMIVDDRVLVKLELAMDGYSRSEIISINPIEVDKARSNFDILLKHARPFEIFFCKK